MRFDFKIKTVQDWIQNRVNIESFLDEPDYPRPLWKEPKRKKEKWSPVALRAFASQFIKSSLP